MQDIGFQRRCRKQINILRALAAQIRLYVPRHKSARSHPAPKPLLHSRGYTDLTAVPRNWSDWIFKARPGEDSVKIMYRSHDPRIYGTE